ncbi:SCY1-like protein 2, partial [Tremellales sp. Uapishka_1]
MLAVASNLFGKASPLAAYNLHSSGPSPASSSTNLPATATSSSSTKSFNVGLWRVSRATHKTTGKDVSVWIFEKRILDAVRNVTAKEWALDQLKKEATSLSRLRHPDILHMVEPLEETRSELTFVTETVTASLGSLMAAAAGSSGGSKKGIALGEIDLDEVEIQKGTLQIAKGLGFLHQQARMVHLNLSPDAILVNAKGDWKLSGLSLTTPLTQPDGSTTKYVYPEIDTRLPPQIQWKLDYLAPEYALDSTLTPASDLYSLGCVLFAIHMGGKPPSPNGNSMQSLRDFADGSLTRKDWMSGPKWERCSAELRGGHRRFFGGSLTFDPAPLESTIPRLAAFTPLLLFPRDLDAQLPGPNDVRVETPRRESDFPQRPSPGPTWFLRTFAEGQSSAESVGRDERSISSAFPAAKRIRNLQIIVKGRIRSGVAETAAALCDEGSASEHAQRHAPNLQLSRMRAHAGTGEGTADRTASVRDSRLWDRAECPSGQSRGTSSSLRIARPLLTWCQILFTRTRILSIKVETLQCFNAMVKTLDKATLTTKLVPLLAKIKTKEPAVMMATLGVHEAMGAKVDREAVASLVLPQLWAMSMGPLLNAAQFGHFMTVVKSLGARVEAEHSQHLRDVKRIEDQTASMANTFSNGNGVVHGNSSSSAMNGEMDFEALVKGQTSAPFQAAVTDPWGDDGWGENSDLDSTLTQNFTPALSMNATETLSTPTPSAYPSQPMKKTTSGSSKLKARPVPPTTFNSALFPDPPPTSTPPPIPSYTASPIPPYTAPTMPSYAPTNNFAPLQPTSSSLAAPLRPSSQSTLLQPSTQYKPLQPSPQTQSTPSQPSPRATQAGGPNYNLSLSPQPVQPKLAPQITLQARPPPGFQPGLMQPSAPNIPAWGGGTRAGKQDWGDFDPLK